MFVFNSLFLCILLAGCVLAIKNPIEEQIKNCTDFDFRFYQAFNLLTKLQSAHCPSESGTKIILLLHTHFS